MKLDNLYNGCGQTFAVLEQGGNVWHKCQIDDLCEICNAKIDERRKVLKYIKYQLRIMR